MSNLKNIMFLTLAIGFSFISNTAFASDNVLQAIQIDGVKDSYKIILKSDDTAEMKKTIQSTNKMVINLKGIRASKSINTIYNNTSSVDSVVVEPTGADSVKILIQAANVNEAEIQFDTLKTPLGVLDKSYQKTSEDSLVLNKPMNTYKSVYDENTDEENTSGLTLGSIMGSSKVKLLKKAFGNEKISGMISFGLIAIILFGGIKLVRGKDSDIKIGLSQGLKERELDLYRAGALNNNLASLNATRPAHQGMAETNYGLKAYQNGTRSPYSSPEIQRPRPTVAQARTNTTPAAQALHSSPVMQKTIQKQAVNPAQMQRPKTTNIDSMKFLESMTKIYEKNGRSDLAQGLKSNMKKATTNGAV